MASTSYSQVGAVVTVSTTGVHCGLSLPQAAQAALQDPRFTAISNGRCYNYLGQVEEPGGNLTLTFALYNGTIAYPCGTAPEMVPESVIHVVVGLRGGVASVQSARPAPTSPGSCDPSVAVRIVGVDDIESTIPAVPQLNVTLASAGSRPITDLSAVLTLDGGSQTFRFGTVSSNAPLTRDGSASTSGIILSSLTFASNEVYPMRVSGSFADGQTFSYVLHFQISHVP